MKVQFKNKEEIKECYIPDNWQDVKIGMYSQLMTAIENKELDQYDLAQEIILALVPDVDDTTLRMLTVNEFNDLYSTLDWVVKTEPEIQIPDKIIIDNIIYGFEPDLYNMFYGEWIDLRSLTKENYVWDNLHQVLACLIRPLKNQKPNSKSKELVEYTLEDRLKRAELFKQKLSINLAHSTIIFFCVFVIQYMTSGKDYTQILEEIMKELPQ